MSIEPLHAWMNKAAPVWTRLLPRTWGNLEWTGYIERTLQDDPSGVSGALALEASLTQFIYGKSLTIGDFLEPDEETAAMLADVRLARTMLTDEVVVAATTDFRTRLAIAMQNYGGIDQGIEEVIADPLALSELASTAVSGASKMKARWFSKGAPAGTPPKYHRQVHEAKTHGALVTALAQTPRDGIHLCLVRDPDIEEFSYFCFGIKDGANVYTLSEETEWAHPLAKHMTRKPSRHLHARMDKFTFPYELIDPQEGKSKAVAERDEEAPAPIEVRMDLNKVNPYSRVWLAMMFECIAREFWGKTGTAALSYSGDRVGWDALRPPSALPVRMADAVAPPVLAPIAREEVAPGAMDESFAWVTKHNAWMEERYAPKVRDEVLMIQANQKAITQEPDTLNDHKIEKRETVLGVHRETGLPAPIGRDFFGNSDRVTLLPLDPTKVGTLDELRRDARWRARYNLAVGVNTLLNEEHRKRKEEIEAWYRAHVTKNIEDLVTAAIRGSFVAESQVYRSGFDTERMRSAPCNIMRRAYAPRSWPPEGFTTWGRATVSLFKHVEGEHRGLRCYLTGSQTAVWLVFSPSLPAGLAALAGVEVKDLPDVLQHWQDQEDYHGNSILNNLDPMEWLPHNPWHEMKFRVCLGLSKSAFRDACKARGIDFDGDWESLNKKPEDHPLYKRPFTMTFGGGAARNN